MAHDTGPHPEGPGRIPAIELELQARGWLGYERLDAPAAALEQIARVHPESHIAAVRGVSEAGGGSFDADTVASAGSYEAALHAAGGACLLVDELLAGRASTGFCGLRPPGHHAEPAQAMGFCLFNNVAVAAAHALQVLGLERVLILDWDVHHGNGTNDIFHSTDQVLFISLHQSPLYPGTGPLADVGSGPGEGFTVNLPVPPGSGESTWLPLVEHIALPVARQYRPQLVLISAGFDAHRADPLAECMLEEGSFARMAAHLRELGAELGVPVGAVLEGGYDLNALSVSVAATMDALSNGTPPGAGGPTQLTREAAKTVGRYWRL